MWLVTADTYKDSYGAEIIFVGIFDDRNKASESANEEIKKGHIVSIQEVEKNKTYDLYLGGYYE